MCKNVLVSHPVLCNISVVGVKRGTWNGMERRNGIWNGTPTVKIRLYRLEKRKEHLKLLSTSAGGARKRVRAVAELVRRVIIIVKLSSRR